MSFSLEMYVAAMVGNVYVHVHVMPLSPPKVSSLRPSLPQDHQGARRPSTVKDSPARLCSTWPQK